MQGLPKPKVVMAVSVGTGVYPPEQIGDTDFFGKGWLGDIRGTIKRAQQLMKLLAGAVSNIVYECFIVISLSLSLSLSLFSQRVLLKHLL